MAEEANQITQLLIDWSKGDRSALDQLVPLVHMELTRRARQYMNRESPAHTLQASALVNEAYVRLLGGQTMSWQGRAHFFSVAAQVMRHILIDHARSRLFTKRGAGAHKVAIDDVAIVSEERAAELVAIDEALAKLAQLDPRKSQIVELRFFGGFSGEETAEILGISRITVTREWQSARAWLRREMSDGKTNQ
jgi:RNA polymerase sigma factor (TIGR02999 family)